MILPRPRRRPSRTIKGGDFNVDTKGNLLVVEEETTIDSIPAAGTPTTT
jgi:hypothetical protein